LLFWSSNIYDVSEFVVLTTSVRVYSWRVNHLFAI